MLPPASIVLMMSGTIRSRDASPAPRTLPALTLASNGWWRRKAGKRDDPAQRAKRAGCRVGKKAVERTAPLAALAYAFALLWYFDHGNVPNDVARARSHAPWYRQKQDVSFADMLAAFRRATWLDELNRMQPNSSIRQNSEDLWLLAGNAA